MLELRARVVLADARAALVDFEESNKTPYWRTRWVALITILRAVGHVLDKVDAPRDAKIAAASRQAFEDMKRSSWGVRRCTRIRDMRQVVDGANGACVP